jgi:hypothetical protein
MRETNQRIAASAPGGGYKGAVMSRSTLIGAILLIGILAAGAGEPSSTELRAAADAKAKEVEARAAQVQAEAQNSPAAVALGTRIKSLEARMEEIRDTQPAAATVIAQELMQLRGQLREIGPAAVRSDNRYVSLVAETAGLRQKVGLAAAREEAEADKAKQDADAAKAKMEEKEKAAVGTIRSNPRKAYFKDFANVPEDYSDRYIRFDGVLMYGDLEHVAEAKVFSANVSTPDGKYVRSRVSLAVGRGIAFVIPDEIGRPLSLDLRIDSQYGVNLCCEVNKSGELYLARIYRVEKLRLNAIDVYEEKQP